MKKLINTPASVVRDLLEGLARQAPNTTLLAEENILLSRTQSKEKTQVAIISGGGSGHEPAHGGYVGTGMLSAAVAGEVFTSPPVDSVLAAIRATTGLTGAVLIVKNYTGDRLNFGLAAEIARNEGIPVQVVIVADDVSLRKLTDRAHRRGIAGTVLVHKITGAAAARSLTLDEVAHIARNAAANIGTMGVALDGCTLPGADKPSFTLADDEIELGLGIHGEKGVERTTPQPADQLAQTLIANIVDDLGLQRGERIALLVNGLGATPQMELDIMLRAAYDDLAHRGLIVERAWSGTLLSALNMPGCSISLMRVDDAALDLLDAPTEALAWPGSGKINRTIRIDAPRVKAPTHTLDNEAQRQFASLTKSALTSIADALKANEPRLTELDSLAGDGDLGASMTRAADALIAMPEASLGTPAGALAAIGATLQRAIAGSSGPFYATGLMRASRHLSSIDGYTAKDWARAFHQAVNAISELGGAKAGDRTMLDALLPAASAFESALNAGQSTQDAFASAVAAADQGALDTAAMTPRAGRASYLGMRAVGSADGGAVAVAIWLKALQPHIDALKPRS
jgi:triose/dihydroxyacetone kinase / FAD-AMP lyase (cyclizing)